MTTENNVLSKPGERPASSQKPKGKIISTGFGEIDKKLGGGIPVGSLTLIEGQSGAGKSVFVQQLIWGSVASGHKVLLFTTENTVKSAISQMESLGLGITDPVLMGWVKIFNVVVSNLQDPTTDLVRGMELFPDHTLIVVDSLTPILAHTTTEKILTYFEQCKILCDDGRTIINTAHTYAFDEQLLIRIRSVCDAHIKMKIEEVGEKLAKVLEVAKIRGADKITGNILSFDVEPGIGMKVMPIGRAKV